MRVAMLAAICAAAATCAASFRVGRVAAPAPSAPAKAPLPPQIAWASSFDAAMAQGRASHRPVFVDFYTDWCGVCKMMDAQTYPDPRVRQMFADRLVGVRVNAEKEGVKMATALHITGYPTLLVIDPDGSLDYRLDGGMYPSEFAVTLQRILHDLQIRGQLEQRLAANPSDLRTATDLLGIYADENRYQQLTADVARIERLDPTGRRGGLALGLMATAQIDLARHDAASARTVLQRALRMSQNPLEVGDAHYLLAQCALTDDDLPAAEHELQAALGTVGASENMRESANAILAKIRAHERPDDTG
jgi:thiol-disulfide isomerase/thioredoxin